MLKIRLQRIGRKNDPSFRIIVTDSRNAAKRGTYVDLLGSFNPHGEGPILNAERAKYWIDHGAQPSITVHNMLVTAGVISGKKQNALPKKTVLKKEESPVVEQSVSVVPKKEETPVAEIPTPVIDAPTEEALVAPEVSTEAPVSVEEKPAE